MIILSKLDRKISNYLDENRFDDIIMIKEGLGVAVLPIVQDDENIVYAGLEPKLNRNLGLIYREGDFESKKEDRGVTLCW